MSPSSTDVLLSPDNNNDNDVFKKLISAGVSLAHGG